jgi:hypothetical protein
MSADDDIELIEPLTIDEARLQMIHALHRAMFGDTWARPESPGAVWADLLNRIARARAQFHR